MPKRKRSSYEDDGSRVQQMRQKDVAEKLTEGKKLLQRALKTAKGFERQKLGKRLKNATASGAKDEVARINREIEALRGLDLGKATDALLFKSLLKVKVIAESHLLPEEVRREVPRPEGTEEQRTALHNVISGMCNMRPIKEAMTRVLGGIYIALGIPMPIVKGKGVLKKEPVKGPVNVNVVAQQPRRVDAEDYVSLGETEERGKSGTGELSWEGFESEDESEHLTTDGGADIRDKEDGGALDEEALSRYDALIGGSSDEESFDESKYNKTRASQPYKRLSLSLSPTPSSSLSRSQSPSPPSRPLHTPKAHKPTKSKPPPIKPALSTFLPTLMGGYWSGSESSASDLEDGVTSIPVRKNRPGQSARRAIWEKKYGERANHIKTGKGPVGQGRGNDDGWDAKRGAIDSSSRRGGSRDGRGGFGGRQRDFRQITGENAIPVEPRKRGLGTKDDVGVLHPSWQAAKKAKDLKKTATFQGKKVTFD